MAKVYQVELWAVRRCQETTTVNISEARLRDHCACLDQSFEDQSEDDIKIMLLEIAEDEATDWDIEDQETMDAGMRRFETFECDTGQTGTGQTGTGQTGTGQTGTGQTPATQAPATPPTQTHSDQQQAVEDGAPLKRYMVRCYKQVNDSLKADVEVMALNETDASRMAIEKACDDDLYIFYSCGSSTDEIETEIMACEPV